MTEDDVEAAQFEIDLKKSDLEDAQARMQDCKTTGAAAGRLVASLASSIESMNRSKVVLASEYVAVRNQFERAKAVVKDCEAKFKELAVQVSAQEKQILADEKALQRAIAQVSSIPPQATILEFKNGIRRDEDEDFE